MSPSERTSGRRTLRRTIAQQIGAMVAALLLVSAAALYGLNGLRSDLGIALGGYRELREVYDVGLHVATAKKAMNEEPQDTARARNELDAAIAKLDRFLASRSTTGIASLADSDEGRRLTSGLRASLRAAVGELGLPRDEAFRPGGNQTTQIDRAISQVAAIGNEIQRTITARESAARSKWHATLVWVAGISAVAIAATVVMALVQYGSVLSPLGHLRNAAGSIAAGQFANRVTPGGFAEFNELGDDFNRMAGELQSIYRDLEQKVATKSAELAQAQRLASVGFLAAGVAHEINNPLSIITGYGERALQHIDLEEGESMLVAVEKCLRVMCEEAYRCKTITDQLLSLARAGNEARKPVDIARLAREVVTSLSVVPEYHRRAVTVDATVAAAVEKPTASIVMSTPSDRGALWVIGSEGELKQAIMNLVVNALEATIEAGQVGIRFETHERMGRVIITDTGRGMSSTTLERVFEPFYTEKRGSRRAGTGLGLSLTFSIVQSHGGTLTAQSSGPGKGSCFTMELPLADRGAV